MPQTYLLSFTLLLFMLSFSTASSVSSSSPDLELPSSSSVESGLKPWKSQNERHKIYIGKLFGLHGIVVCLPHYPLPFPRPRGSRIAKATQVFPCVQRTCCLMQFFFVCCINAKQTFSPSPPSLCCSYGGRFLTALSLDSMSAESLAHSFVSG